MDKTIRITVDGEPVPAARPRFSGRHAYQPARNRAYREQVTAAALEAMSGREMMTGEVTAQIEVYRRFKPTTRNFGDCDNHAKAILDGLSGVCFSDDAQIVRLTVEKFTDKVRPRAEVILQRRIREDDQLDVVPRTESKNSRPSTSPCRISPQDICAANS